MTTQAIVVLTPEELRKLISEAVTEALAVKKNQPKRLVKKTELATALSCSAATINRMMDEGLPYVRAGSDCRYDVDACLEWMAAHDTSSKNERTPSLPHGVRLLTRSA